MNTYNYGIQSVATGLGKSKTIPFLLSWSVILFETLFPLALIVPQGLLIVVLGGGLIFHLSTAILMGLNTFVWSFVAAYPSLILLNYAFRGD